MGWGLSASSAREPSSKARQSRNWSRCHRGLLGRWPGLSASEPWAPSNSNCRPRDLLLSTYTLPSVFSYGEWEPSISLTGSHQVKKRSM